MTKKAKEINGRTRKVAGQLLKMGKIHATVDALGNPTGFALSPGQAHDLEGADALLPGLEAGTLIADKAFDAEERVLKPLAEAGKAAVMVSMVQGFPAKAASAADARFGIAAMPPKAIRTALTTPAPSRDTLKAPQSAEMSSSRRLEIL